MTYLVFACGLGAGIILGPATPGFDADLALAGQLAEIGIMLMMFGVGLHFSIDDLMEVKRIAIPGAMVQIAAATAEPGDWLLTGTDRLGRPVRLVVKLGALGREDQGLVIGRSRQIADLVLGDASVSRRHARIVRLDGGIGVVDLKSKRGTWVGSTRLEPYAKPTRIEAGTFVQFGTVTLGAGRA